MLQSLNTEEKCREYLEELRWHGEPICPHCGSISNCRKRFTITIGTMFEGSHVPLDQWFYAISIFLSFKKGLSSAQLARSINVTQKTAWFMLQRIRKNMKDDDATFDDMTQMDETYMGGKTSAKHQGRRKCKVSKTGKKNIGRSVATNGRKYH